jgi:hydroxymethylpyrimidine kinase / phosphomethylpyrimidine kinase / thiamine-phosphate diphosphorylase
MLHPNQNFIEEFSKVILVGGSDSSGGAGLSADQKVLNSLEVDSRSVVTAITSQTHKSFYNIQYASKEIFESQLKTASNLMNGKGLIKLGMLGNLETVLSLKEFLIEGDWRIVCDPVLVSSTGRALLSKEGIECFKEFILPKVYLLTPNIMEVELLLNRSIKGPKDMELAAKDLLKMGVQNVLIKGGHLEETGNHSPKYSHDFFANGNQSLWINGYRTSLIKFARGTGCALASAITGAMASGLDLLDSLVLGKMIVKKGIRSAFEEEEGLILNMKGSWKEGINPEDFPWITNEFYTDEKRISFPIMKLEGGRTNLYPIVDRAEWLEKLFPLGIKIVQLRIKDLQGDELEKEVKKAVEISNKFDGQLFINDYWELAIKYNAYGVHLGHEDMQEAHLKEIADANIRLGLSTHCYYEASLAHGYNPSYIAFGPVYYTALKAMKFKPQGLENLKLWRSMFNRPLVAIGGINIEKISDVMECNPDMISVVRDITLNKSPTERVVEYQNILH